MTTSDLDYYTLAEKIEEQFLWLRDFLRELLSDPDPELITNIYDQMMGVLEEPAGNASRSFHCGLSLLPVSAAEIKKEMPDPNAQDFVFRVIAAVLAGGLSHVVRATSMHTAYYLAKPQ
jgi:hypothetical protein